VPQAKLVSYLPPAGLRLITFQDCDWADADFEQTPALTCQIRQVEAPSTNDAIVTNTYRSRMAVLVIALALVGALTLVVVQQSWKITNSLESRLTSGQMESFELATEFQSSLLKLNELMMRITARRDPTSLTEFREAGEKLNHWIDQHDPNVNKNSILTTDSEKRILPEINAAFDKYLEAANGVITNQQPAAMTPNEFAQLGRVEQQSQQLFNLGNQLAESHAWAHEHFLSEAIRELAVLRAVLTGSVVTMIALVGVLGRVLYRDLVKPLRIRLVQNQTLLERHEKLATLGTLAAGIAHEIRNPLTSIKARLYTLGKHIKGNEPGLTDADVISDEIVRLERIVQDVLSFARPSEPKMQLTPVESSLREVHSLMTGTLAQNGVQLKVETGDGLFVSIDTALIKQVLINLVRNAAEAIEGGGKVTLRARSGRAKLNGVESAVAILEVVDTGKGIPPEVEARLFDPFFTTKEAGTGLGLSIAARIIEKHGGLLQYQTQVGRGTTFGIILPSVSPSASNGSQANQNG